MDKIYKIALNNPEEFDENNKRTYFVYQVLMRNVDNMKELRELIFQNKLNCCLINPILIVDPWIVSVAVNKSLNDQVNNKMKTKSIYTETLYNLSSTKNISESLKQFSVTDDDTDVLVMIVTEDENGKDLEEIIKQIKGDEISINDLNSNYNKKLICALHNINENQLAMSSLSDNVLTSMAYKPFK